MDGSPISVYDIAICGFSLLLSIGTGFYQATSSRSPSPNDSRIKYSQKDEYMMGSKRMPRIPVALSLLTTYISGILMIGFPGEMFERGPQIWLNSMTGAIASVLTAAFFLPIFYKMRAACLHDYFEHRFQSVLIRRTFSVLFLAQNISYMAIVIYAPAVALASVINVQKWILILIFGVSVTLYTTIGGLKAVVWTDAIQAVMMYGGLFAILYTGLKHPRVNGFVHPWKLAYDTGRVQEIWRVDPTLAQYNSLWINLISGTVIWMAYFGFNQLAVQRYLCLPKLSDSKKIIYLMILPYCFVCSLVSFLGFMILAYYFNCNPLETGQISSIDQLTILFAKEILTPTPGLFGLYFVCIMSSTLSTLSSGINSMAVAFYEDFLKRFLLGRVTDSEATLINKVITLVIGVICTLLAFAAEPLGGVLRMCINVLGALSGPFVGIFILAMFWPKSGYKAAFVSLISSSIIMAVICIINYIEDPYARYYHMTNTTLEGCNGMNFTLREVVDYDAHFGNPNASYIARISTFAYPTVGFIIMLVIGVALTCYWDEQNPEKIIHLTFYGRNMPWPKGMPLSDLLETDQNSMKNSGFEEKES